MDGLNESIQDQGEPGRLRFVEAENVEDMDTEWECPDLEYLFDEDCVQSQVPHCSATDSRTSTQDSDVQGGEHGSGSDNGDEPVMNNGPSVHPLLIPNVIEEILKHLPAKDIETFRRVSHTWNSEACTVLRSKRIVVFIDPDAVRVYNNAMRNTTTFPHAQFEFCIPDITGFVDEDLREFWEKFGPHVKSLEFRQVHLFWRDFLEVLENKVPNLEKLTLKHLPRNVLHAPSVRTEMHQIRSVKLLRIVSLPALTQNAVERLANVLKAFPQLEVIEVLPIKQPALKSKVSNILVEVLQTPEVLLRNLRKVNLNLELNSDGLDAIASKGFPLRRLHMTLANGVKASSFKNFVHSFRSTLEELKISFPETYTNYQMFLNQNKSMHPDECVQLLSKLRSLRMTNFKGSINFVQNLPELEYLEFTTNDLAKSVPFGFKCIGGSFARYNQDHPLKGLKMIANSSSSPKLAETLMLDSIARCFPFLNRLYVDGIDDDGLGVIYRNLPFLAEVELNDARCTDQGLTGIPLEICQDMLETSTFIIVQAEKYRRDLFIGSLQFLRKLTIVAPQISDASVALGLVDCKNMRVLKFGSSLISDTGIIFITDRFCKQLDLLDVTECTEITEQSKFYAREKLTGKLKVSDVSQENPAQSKPPGKDESASPPNPDRGIVISKPKTQLIGVSAMNSKNAVPDTEFFEEVSEEELRERAVGVPIVPPAFHQDRRNRFRIMRIRDALRRNGDFMRTLQRLGPQQFQRLFRVELQAGNRHQDQEIAEDPEFVQLDIEAEAPVPRVNDVVINDDEPGQVEGQIAQVPENRDIEEDDGGPAAGNAVLNRLPEIHIAEIYRLGLRPEDIEFWLLNRPLFEREENGNGNIRNAAGIRVMQQVDGIGFFREDVVGRAGAGAFQVDDDLMDMEAFRQVVMNAFGDEAFEG